MYVCSYVQMNVCIVCVYIMYVDMRADMYV